MKYNILMIGIETCRKDALQCYNPKRCTPFIQEFSSKSLVFDNYFITAPNTYQSWGSLFSGKYAHNSGIGTKPKEKLKDVKPMNRVFWENGYYIKTGGYGLYQPMGSEVDYIDSHGELTEPFFVFVGDLCAHYSYGLSYDDFRKSDRKQLIDAHGKCAEMLDTNIRDIINEYLKYDNTIIILTADHGDMIVDGGAEHFNNMEPQTINVPFILYHPQIKHRTVKGLFSNVDVFPTLLGLCEINYKDKFDGTDLSSHILKDLQFPNRCIQVGPSIGCPDAIEICEDGQIIPVIPNYTYSRKEALMRYKDYVNRQHVNKIFSYLEKSNLFKDEWVARSKLYNNLSYANNKEYIKEIIDILDLRSDLKILDAGAGTGMISTSILEEIDRKKLESVDIYLIDQCYSMLDKCANSDKIKKYVADIEHLQFVPDNSIDRIICSMVLHSEFNRINNITNEFHRILKNDGILVIAEGIPMDDSLLDFYISFLTKKEKRYMFTKDDLIHIIKDFNCVETKEIIMKRQSIRRWLEYSCVDKAIADNIFMIHLHASEYIKEKMNMIIQEDDIFCDWKFAIIKYMKSTVII